jgi:hypothetical protein
VVIFKVNKLSFKRHNNKNDWFGEAVLIGSEPLFISVGSVIPGRLHSCIACFRFAEPVKNNLFSFYYGVLMLLCVARCLERRIGKRPLRPRWF